MREVVDEDTEAWGGGVSGLLNSRTRYDTSSLAEYKPTVSPTLLILRILSTSVREAQEGTNFLQI